MTTIDLQRRYSVQDQVRQDQEVGFGLMFWLSRAGELVAPWWSPERDKQLRSYAKNSDHFSGAEWMIGTKLASVPYRVEARDSSIKSHIKIANEYQAILDNMVQFGQGWEVFWTKFYHDLWECDNGAFGEVIGEGDPNGPIQGPALGLSHLDSTRCTRTSNPEYPVVYIDVSGRRYRFHHTRIVFRSQSPSSSAEMHNVGFCWLSRAINSVQRLIDVATYNQEKLGSRPLRQLILGKGIDADSIVGAIQAADEVMDNRGLRRYAQAPILAHPSLTEWDIEQRDLASLPDGFDEKTTTEFAMFVIALAGGFPPRWLWPATSTGATKADAMYQHIAGTGGGATWHLNMMRDLLSYSGRAAEIARLLPPKFLPKEVRLVFDYQDDEQDRLQADVQATRAKTRQIDLTAGVVTVRVSREQALNDGDLTQAQFNQMELEDGRLPNGDDVLTLFSSVDSLFITLLDLGVDDPLAIDFNDPLEMMLEIEEAALDAQDRLISAGSRMEREKVEQTIAALGKLKGLYQEIVTQQITQEQQLEQAQQEGKPPPGLPPQGEPEQPPAEDEEESTEDEKQLSALELELKAFNYGAKAGEVISGQLARSATGEFISREELSAARNKLLADLIARLRAKRGGSGKKGRKGASAAKREANRETVAEKAGVEGDTLDAMSAMRKGDPVDADTQASLIAQGLAEVNDDGSVTMTTAGRSLLSAANSGDVDKAKKALAKAAEPPKPKRGKKPKRGGGGGGKKPEEEEFKPTSFTTAKPIDSGGGTRGETPTERSTRREIEQLTDELLDTPKSDTRRTAELLWRIQRARADLEKETNLVPFELKGSADFGLNVRAAIRGLWSGATEEFSFVDQMISTISRQLKAAWLEGAKECGIAEDELTAQEISARDNLITSQFPHLPSFAADISAGSKANGGKLGRQLQRGSVWVNRYEEAKNQGKVMACKDKKLKWVLGEAEHCGSCLKLNGKVKRASIWNSSGIVPQVAGATYLECRGYNCACTLQQTSDKASPGPLPSLP